MLGYVCKYTPMELFEAMDTEITRLEPSVTDFNHADTLMHANICSYIGFGRRLRQRRRRFLKIKSKYES